MANKELLNQQQKGRDGKEIPGFVEKPSDNKMIDIKISLVPGRTYDLTIKKGTTVSQALEKAQRLHNIRIDGKQAKIKNSAVKLTRVLKENEIILIVANVSGGKK